MAPPSDEQDFIGKEFGMFAQNQVSENFEHILFMKALKYSAS